MSAIVVPSFGAVVNMWLAAAMRAGMFCTMIAGLPGMCLPRWRAVTPRLQVVAAAHAGADDEGDLLAGVEIVRRGRRRSKHDQRRGDGRPLEERCGGKTSPRATTHRKSPEWDVLLNAG